MCTLWRSICSKVSTPLIHQSPLADLGTSDLLSRHVNKCHSTEKKPAPAQNNNRRKPRQLSTSPATLPPPAPQFGQPAYGQGAQIDSNASADPFSNGYQQSPRRNSAAHSFEAGDPPSLSSSSLASNSSASASVDSLPHSATEPVFHLPQQHYNPHQHFGRQWASNSYPYMQSFDGTAVSDSLHLFEQKMDLPFPQPAHGVHQYNDLPTPMGYPGAPFRPSSSEQSNSLDPFIPNQFASMQALGNAGPLDSTAYMPSLHQTQASATTRTANGITRADGTFSSAFGLMSLDDPNVLAGISADGIPFFDNAMAGQNGVTDIHSMLSQNNFMLPDGSNNLPTPNTRERENNALRDLWSAFLRDPTTGLKADGTEMGRPEFPTPAHPQMHRRSSSYGGSGTSKAPGQPPLSHSNSNPTANDVKPNITTAMPGSVVQRLEDQVSKLEAVAIPASTVLSGGSDGLKSYEEAILSRKAPVLKLPTKMKTRDGTSVTTSSILPPLSQSGRMTTMGGGVGSLHALQQQPLPTAAGVSSVPVGSTPNSALQQHLQQFGPEGRPVIAMPKPRSRRPSNATGPPSRPTSANSGGPGGGIGSNYASQPNSRPGTASSAGGGYGNPSASPPQIPHAHSQPNSRPPTAAGMSPSHNFAYAPPPLHYSVSPTGAAYNFQPGSLPAESSMSPTAHQVVSALSSAGMIDNSTSVVNRPSYKRLASQTLEPATTKRPHIRRGDTNFNATNEEGFDSDATSDAERSVTSERSYSGHEHYASAGPNGPVYGRGWSGTMMSGYTNGARRMSEPAVAAPRMIMRMPAGANQ